MKIAIIGYGKIGRMIETIAREKGHEIGSCIDIDNQELMSADNLVKHDVAIEFTRPETARDNISKCLDAGLPVVSGTTGWTDKLDEIAERCRREEGSFLYASNFSLGVNILFYLNRKLAGVMSVQSQYDVSLKEIHHDGKLDAPSGTALTLAGDILAAVERKKDWSLKGPASADRGSGQETDAPAGTDADTGDTTDSLMIEAVREGTVPGVHEIIYESEFDSLSIRHSAKDRRGFALGAVMAAEFIRDRKGFFTMKEVLDL